MSGVRSSVSIAAMAGSALVATASIERLGHPPAPAFPVGSLPHALAVEFGHQQRGHTRFRAGGVTPQQDRRGDLDRGDDLQRGRFACDDVGPE